LKLAEREGIPVPKKMKIKSWIVTGPPGCGKSWLIHKVRGWPGEATIDLSMKKWWKAEPLTHRPREVHFIFPYVGLEERFSVYDDRWEGIDELPELDMERIRVPHKKKFFLSPDWRERFVFDFILPPPAWTLAQRRTRYASPDKRPMDHEPSETWIAWQSAIHWRAALYLHRAGMRVLIRPFNVIRPFTPKLLKRLSGKKKLPTTEALSPSLDWSKASTVRRWLLEAGFQDAWSATRRRPGDA